MVHIPTSAAAVFETPLDLGEEISVGNLHLLLFITPLEVIFWIFKQRNDDAGDFWFLNQKPEILSMSLLDCFLS